MHDAIENVKGATGIYVTWMALMRMAKATRETNVVIEMYKVILVISLFLMR